MFIKFANTDGFVYDYERTTLNSNYDLGVMLTYDDGIIIIDRYPTVETTQLDVDNIIKTLRYILKNNYSLQTDKINIFLPRMDANISKQARIQAKFAKLSLDAKQTIDYFKINLIHL